MLQLELKVTEKSCIPILGEERNPSLKGTEILRLEKWEDLRMSR